MTTFVTLGSITPDLHPKSNVDSTLYAGNRKVLSFGPRVEKAAEVAEGQPTKMGVYLPSEGEEPDFYTLFVHGLENEAGALSDVATEDEVVRLARAVLPGILLSDFLTQEPGIIPPEDALVFFSAIRQLISEGNAALDTYTFRDADTQVTA